MFSPRELQRLAVYRAAVVARFYTDECAPFAYPRSPQPRRIVSARRGPNR